MKRWLGRTVVCVASGPSLTRDDVALASGYPVIVCNTSFRMAPLASVLLAQDLRWWRAYFPEVRNSFYGERWTTDKTARDEYGLNYARHDWGDGISKREGVINGGGSTGIAAIGLAHMFGAARIVLLGYDMQRTFGRSHWHGDHKDLNNGTCFPLWIRRIERVASDLSAQGVEVVNATRVTAIKRIAHMPLTEALSNARASADRPAAPA